MNIHLKNHIVIHKIHQYKTQLKLLHQLPQQHHKQMVDIKDHNLLINNLHRKKKNKYIM